ncbi:MAG: proline iminopeptidase-family hydrolase [Actinomycetota bacterium]|nr:proline iminopeptidase-family hydrolase [Actinomycetota bacterium]
MIEEQLIKFEVGIRYGYDFAIATTWCKIFGSEFLTSGKAPLVVLHGGPGATHSYCLPMADLTRDQRSIIFYDQIGNGNSSHFPDAPVEFWDPSIFVEELHNLVVSLGIEKNHSILGQSWGGFLAQEYVLAHPQGINSMVLSNTAASFPHFLQAANELRTQLPQEVEATLQRCEANGTTDSQEYLDACDVFYRRHVCRLEEWPEEITTSFAAIDDDPTVYHTMNGPSEFHVIGTLKDWSSLDRLHEIETPTLIVCGRYDEAMPWLSDEIASGIVNSAVRIFEQSSHMPFHEERERYMEVVGAFLNSNG